MPQFCLAAAGAALGVAVNGAINKWHDRPFFDNWQGSAVGGALAAVGAGMAAGPGAGAAFFARGSVSTVGAGTGSGVLAQTANHLFGQKSLAKHRLDGVLNAFEGNAMKATSAIQRAYQAHVSQAGIADGLTGDVIVRVAGQDVTVRGRVIDGVARIGTAFIPEKR